MCPMHSRARRQTIEHAPSTQACAEGAYLPPASFGQQAMRLRVSHFVGAGHHSAQLQLHTMLTLPALQAVYARVADGLILNNWSEYFWLGQGVTLVDWFRVFAERLQRGYYQADKLTPHSNVHTSPDALAFRGISLYPRLPPDYVRFELPMLPGRLAGAAACCGGRAGPESCLHLGKSTLAAGA